MGELINLRRARKAKVRAAAGATADANRAAFGRSNAEKTAALADEHRRDRILDGARREDAPVNDPARD